VLSDRLADTHTLRRVLADLPRPRVGITAGGGPATAAVARALDTGGTLLTYGGVYGQPPLRLSSLLLARKSLTVKGIDPVAVVATEQHTKRREAVARALQAARAGSLRLLHAREPFADAARYGVLRAMARHEEERTVVLTM
jgi:NADPH:quinone reductase-like Zn-dependent oxidoreductase